MSDKEQPKEEQDGLNFNFQDILGDDVNTSSSSFQAMPNFNNEDNQSASYNNLPAELQHLFSTKSTDDLLKESNASSSLHTNPLLWNSNDNTPNTSTTPFVTPSPLHDSSKPSSNSQSVLSNSPMSQHSPQAQPQSSPEISPSQESNPPPALNQSSPTLNIQYSPQMSAQSPKVPMHGSPQIKAQSPHQGAQLSRSNSQHSPVIQHSPVAAQQSPLSSHSQPLPQHSPLLNSSQSPRAHSQQLTGTNPQSSPQIINNSPQSINQGLPQSSPQPSPQQTPPQPQQTPPQQGVQEPIVQNSPQPISQSPHQLHQSPQAPQQQTVSEQNIQRPPATPSATGAPHLTLLDNLAAQLPPDRRESFFRLFRQLQNNEVTANQFLEQAKILLDQQQYQQLENLKSRPANTATAPPPNVSTPPTTTTTTSSPRYVPVRPPIQPQQPIPVSPQQQQQQAAFKNKRTMSSSQLRAEDTQRAMSGLITPQAKRSRLSDIPPTSSPQPLPMYRPPLPPNTTPPPQQIQQQQPMQHIQMQQQPPPPSPQQQQQQMHQQVHQQQQMQQQQPIQSNGQVNYENYTATNEEETIGQTFMNTEMLTDALNKLASLSEITTVEKDVVTMIALAAQTRMKEIIHHMIYASKHRIESQEFVQPPESGGIPYKIADIQDVKKQLLAIERVEREEERKRKEMMVERERKAQMGDGESGEGGEDDRPSKKKKKKELGPGVTARYMSEGVRKKNTDETALMIAGGVKKSWMLTGIQAKEAASRQAPSSPAAPVSASPTNTFSSPFNDNTPTSPPISAASPASTPAEDQPRGRGRPRRRKSGSGEMLTKKDRSKSSATFNANRTATGSDNRFFLPPSTIGRPHRLGEQGTRKITTRDALFVLEDECATKRQKPRRTLLKAYAQYLK